MYRVEPPLPKLHSFHLTIAPGEAWCLYGNNSSGMDELADYLSQDGDPQKLGLQLPGSPGWLSFKSQQLLFENEVHNDDSNFLDHPDPGTLLDDYLPAGDDREELLDIFRLKGCLGQGLRQLSSGQLRKSLVARAILSGTSTLLLQNPYDGLDIHSRLELERLLGQLHRQGRTLIYLVNLASDIPAWCSHLAIFHDRQLQIAGSRSEVLPVLGALSSENQSQLADCPLLNCEQGDKEPEQLVLLRQGHATYGQRPLFAGVNLKVGSGDHTLITGPNGCGKSTLLDIICGDNANCYANNLTLFGRRRGSGESIWQLKEQMGILTPALHREHMVPGSASQIVLSGLYDSIGLYRRVKQHELAQARSWLTWLGIGQLHNRPFRSLSHAQQRLVLIARAMIKHPKLLILDEPTQGLDEHNRQLLLDLLERIAGLRLSTILYVSHRQDEYRPFFKQQLRLDEYTQRCEH